jgi:hypothetical protein
MLKIRVWPLVFQVVFNDDLLITVPFVTSTVCHLQVSVQLIYYISSSLMISSVTCKQLA